MLSAVTEPTAWNAFWSFAEPIVAGTVTAVVWVGLVWLIARVRDKNLEGQVRKSLSEWGVSVRKEHVGVIVHNDTHVPIVIREVKMRSLFGEPRPVSFLILDHAGPGEQFSLDIESTDADSRNFVELPAFTSGVWGTPNRPLPCFGPAIRYTACRITAHYLTLFKTPRVITVEVSEPHPRIKMFNDAARPSLKSAQSERSDKVQRRPAADG